MKVKVVITFILILLVFLTMSCKKRIFNPSIPNRTEFIEEPIANLSIPSKGAVVDVIPVEAFIDNEDPVSKQIGKTVYGHFEHYFEFKGRFYLTAAFQYIYGHTNEVIMIGNTTLMDYPNGHILEIDVNDGFKMKEVKSRIGRNNPEYTRMAQISTGNAYEDDTYIYVQDTEGENYFQSPDLINWKDTQSKTPPQGAKKREAVDMNRVQITANNGVTYTYVYTGGGLDFSVQRLDDRMKQLAQRLETKFDFKEEDFNNHHLFDVGINTSGGTDADYRINPVQYIKNDTNYVWIGKKSPHQIWLMPVQKDGKDYLIRFVEHCAGGGYYTIKMLETNINTYKKAAETSLSVALAAVASDKPQSEIELACYESIKADANYKVNKYFYDVAAKMGALQGFWVGSPTVTEAGFISPTKPLTHYVIEFIDIN